MVSTALEAAPPTLSIPKTSIIVTEGSAAQQEVAQQLRDAVLSSSTSPCDIISLSEAASMHDISERFCVFLTESDMPILQELDQGSFPQLQSVLTSAQGIVWVSKGGGLPAQNPDYQVADGLLRTLRTENPMLKAVTLALDPSQSISKETAKLIFNVFRNTAMKDVNDFETEYIEKAGVLYTNRMVEAEYMNQSIHKVTQPQESLSQPYCAPGIPPLALSFETPGLLDSQRCCKAITAKPG